MTTNAGLICSVGDTINCGAKLVRIEQRQLKISYSNTHVDVTTRGKQGEFDDGHV